MHINNSCLDAEFSGCFKFAICQIANVVMQIEKVTLKIKWD